MFHQLRGVGWGEEPNFFHQLVLVLSLFKRKKKQKTTKWPCLVSKGQKTTLLHLVFDYYSIFKMKKKVLHFGIVSKNLGK